MDNLRGKNNCEQLRELWEGGRARLEEISRDKGRTAVLSSAKVHQDHVGKDTAVYTTVWATRQLLRPLLVSPPPATYHHQSSEICCSSSVNSIYCLSLCDLLRIHIFSPGKISIFLSSSFRYKDFVYYTHRLTQFLNQFNQPTLGGVMLARIWKHSFFQP